MAKNPALVPVKVTDCNGVLTTRWKRPAAAATAPERIPAPALVMVVNEDMDRQIALTRAAANYVSVLRDDDADFERVRELDSDAREDFKAMPTPLLREIAAIDDYSWFKMTALKAMLEDGASHASIRDILQVADTLIDSGVADDMLPDYAPVISAYPGLAPLDVDGEYPELRREQLKGIADVTEAIEVVAVGEHVPWPRADTGATVIEDPRLLAMALEFPAETARTIRERRTIDPDEIAAVVRSTTPAISVGHL